MFSLMLFIVGFVLQLLVGPGMMMMHYVNDAQEVRLFRKRAFPPTYENMDEPREAIIRHLTAHKNQRQFSIVLQILGITMMFIAYLASK